MGAKLTVKQSLVQHGIETLGQAIHPKMMENLALRKDSQGISDTDRAVK